MAASDVQLLQNWRAQGDAAAFAELVRRYGGLVYGTARRILGDATEAEDVAQEAFLRLSQTGADTEVASLGGWLHAVTTHRAIDRLRSEERRAAREQTYAATPSQAYDDLNEAWRDLEPIVDEAIDALPLDVKSAIIGHFLEGKTHKAVARESGVSRSSATRRIQRGVDDIRTHLEKRGVTVTGAALATGLAGRLATAAPNALTRKLGKLSLSGAATATGTIAPTTASPLGGWLAWTAIAIVAAGAITAAWQFTPNKPTPEPTAQTTPVATPPLAPIVTAATAQAEPDTSESIAIEDDPNTYTFTTIDENGNPLEGVNIYIFANQIRSRPMMFSSSDSMNITISGPYVTNENGVATLPFRPEVDSVSHRKFASAVFRLKGKYIGNWRGTPQTDTETTITLAPTKSISGTVKLPPGYNPATVRVHVLHMRIKDDTPFGTSLSFHEEYVETPSGLVDLAAVPIDAFGNFTLPDVPANGIVDLEVRGPGLGSRQHRIADTTVDEKVAIELAPEGAIEGELRWAHSDQPAGGIRVWARPSHMNGGVVNTSPIEGFSDRNGRYRIGGLSGGAYTILVQNIDEKPAWVASVVPNVEVSSGLVTEDANVWLEAGVIQTGRVTVKDSGEPIAEAALVAMNGGAGGEAVSSTYTDENGYFQLRLPQGDHYIYPCTLPTGIILPNPQAHWDVTVTPETHTLPPLDITFEAGEPEPISLDKMTLTGMVLDRDGNPLKGIAIGFNWDKPESLEMWLHQANQNVTRTDVDGRFSVRVYSTGSYKVHAGGGEYSQVLNHATFKGKPDETIDTGTYTLWKLTSYLNVRFLSSDGTPIENADIYPYAEDYGSPYPEPSTNANGELELKNLPEGPVRLWVNRPGYEPKEYTVEAPGDYDITLEPAREETPN